MTPLRLARIASLCAVVIVACSSAKLPPTDDTGPTGPTPGGSGGGDDGGSTPSACGFAATPATFTLPVITGAPDPPFAELANTLTCTSGTLKVVYSLIDMNGDAWPDLVLTSTCDDTTIGTQAWLVYLNTGTGFATNPITYELPPSSATDSACAKYTLIDVNGDYSPDWVVTSLCDDATVGTTRWLVYQNGASGFAQTATTYALPPGYPNGSFVATSATTTTCTDNAGPPVFELFDINGDLIPDFVMNQACNDATVGTTSWRVYLGSASGAAQTATSFALPTSPTFTTGAFETFGGTLSCSASVSKPGFALWDFDDDGKLDIMATQICLDDTVGTTRWLLYQNSGTGFAATPATVTLPTITDVSTNAFASLTASGSCTAATSQPGYTLADGNGDGRLDLMVLSDCDDPLTGATYWQLFINDATGFSAGVHFTLPSVLGATAAAPEGLTAALQCTAPAHPGYVTTYLTAPLAVVETAACSDSSVGFARWLVYAASCQ